nr:hypothetical protein [uncultured Bacteroides sp.]
MIDFFPDEHKSSSNRQRFGVCDTPPPPAKKAYIDESNGSEWIAIVDNYYSVMVNFIPIDNCIEIRRPDNTMDNRCDGCLYYEQTILFIELKQRKTRGNQWIKDAEHQLRVTIGHFEKTPQSELFSTKKAYIANSEKPHFRSAQTERMENFFSDTGYILRIENVVEIV